MERRERLMETLVKPVRKNSSSNFISVNCPEIAAVFIAAIFIRVGK